MLFRPVGPLLATCSLVPLSGFDFRGEWRSQFLRNRSFQRIMNSADQFEAIVGEHYESLFRFALSLTRTEFDARDLTQETFCVWAAKGHQLRDIAKVKTWLFTTLHRAFLQALRRQSRFPQLELEESMKQLPVCAPEPAYQLDSSQVLAALARVDDLLQAAVALFYLEDPSYKSIAAILNVPVGTVKLRIARGIAQLREILISDSNTPPCGHPEWDSSPTLAREPFLQFWIIPRSPPRLAVALTHTTNDSMMKTTQLKWAGQSFGRSVTSIKSAALLLLLCAAAALSARADNSHRAPDLPPICEKIAPPADNRVVVRVFATGVQIYQWNGSAWAFIAPVATLFSDAHHHSQVGTHFATPAGPAWESKSGSRVVEQRVDGCTPDPTAIPWLLLRTISEEGKGIFNGVSVVQRVNTVGGIAPSEAGTSVGEERQVPYTAEYVFYRSTAKRYQQENLVSDLAGVAQLQDPSLVNAWGVSFGGAGPFWVSANGMGKSTLYAVTNDANGAEIITKQALEVSIPGAGRPTGVVNNNKGGFNGDVFLFASLDGVISGWRSPLGTTAETLAMRPGAAYTGLALVTNSHGPLLLAANFLESTINVYDTNSSLVAQLTDQDAPAGYAPFNVQLINGTVFVTFAKHDRVEHDNIPERGHGLIDIIDPETGAFHRFATGSDAGGKLREISSPWGMALAPNSFGKHGGDLLVGNFGNGTIMTFGTDGKFHGLLKGLNHHPIAIEGLWGLTFGNGGRAGSPDALFFAAGPIDESHGLFGSLRPAPGDDESQDESND